MTTALEGGWVVSSTPRLYFTPGKASVPIVQEAGWAPGPVWTGGKPCHTGIGSPDRPARSSVAIPTELPGPQTSQIVIPIYSQFPLTELQSLQDCGFWRRWDQTRILSGIQYKYNKKNTTQIQYKLAYIFRLTCTLPTDVINTIFKFWTIVLVTSSASLNSHRANFVALKFGTRTVCVLSSFLV